MPCVRSPMYQHRPNMSASARSSKVWACTGRFRPKFSVVCLRRIQGPDRARCPPRSRISSGLLAFTDLRRVCAAPSAIDGEVNKKQRRRTPDECNDTHSSHDAQMLRTDCEDEDMRRNERGPTDTACQHVIPRLLAHSFDSVTRRIRTSSK